MSDDPSEAEQSEPAPPPRKTPAQMRAEFLEHRKRTGKPQSLGKVESSKFRGKGGGRPPPRTGSGRGR